MKHASLKKLIKDRDNIDTDALVECFVKNYRLWPLHTLSLCATNEPFFVVDRPDKQALEFATSKEGTDSYIALRTRKKFAYIRKDIFPDREVEDMRRHLLRRLKESDVDYEMVSTTQLKRIKEEICG